MNVNTESVGGASQRSMKRWVMVSLLLEKGLRLAGWFEFCKRTSQDNDAMYRKRRGKTKTKETKLNQ